MDENRENSHDEHGPNGHDPDGLTGIAAAAALAAGTLSGDLRDALLGMIRAMKNPWPMLREHEQQVLVAIVEHECETLIRRAVEIIAASDLPAVSVTLEQLNFKKGAEAKLLFGVLSAQTRHQLVDAQGGRIVLVIADPDKYRGARGIAAIDRDEPELPIAVTAPPESEPPLADLEPPADLGLGEEPPEHLGYRAGYADGLDGVPWADLQYPYDDGTPEHARFQAGWWTAWLERVSDPEERQRQGDAARTWFAHLGRTAASQGAQPTDNPFPEWMPAWGWWDAGFFSDRWTPPTDEEATRPRRRGRPRKDQGESPAP